MLHALMESETSLTIRRLREATRRAPVPSSLLMHARRPTGHASTTTAPIGEVVRSPASGEHMLACIHGGSSLHGDGTSGGRLSVDVRRPEVLGFQLRWVTAEVVATPRLWQLNVQLLNRLRRGA